MFNEAHEQFLNRRRPVGPEDFQIGGATGEFVQRGPHRRVVTMAVDIHVEDIFPQRMPGRTRFQARHRDAGIGERQQQFMGAGAIRRRHDQRGLVTPGRTGIVLAEHQEARRVVGFVLDIFRESRQAVTVAAAVSLAIAAAPASSTSGAFCAACALLPTGMRCALGSIRFSHSWHCANDWACE